MSFRVSYFCQYLTNHDGNLRQADFDALKFVKALKGDPIIGWGHVTIEGRKWRFDATNAHDVYSKIAPWVTRIIANNDLDGNVIIVPIPGSAMTLGCSERAAMLSTAEAAAASLQGVRVGDVLRWTEPMTKSRSGGPRDARYLAERLHVRNGEWLEGANVVLLDDVQTGGGHLRAAASRLGQWGAEVVLGIAVGRTLHEAVDDPFDIPEETLDDDLADWA